MERISALLPNGERVDIITFLQIGDNGEVFAICVLEDKTIKSIPIQVLKVTDKFWC